MEEEKNDPVDICVFCGRRIEDKEGRFIRIDDVYCTDCYRELGLATRARDDDVEGE